MLSAWRHRRRGPGWTEHPAGAADRRQRRAGERERLSAGRQVAAQAASHYRHGLELGLRGGWSFLATSAAADGHQQGHAKTVAHRATSLERGAPVHYTRPSL